MTSASKVAPYGTWRSAISADILASAIIGLDDLLIDPVTSEVFHVEKRPTDSGRHVIVRTKDDIDVFGGEWNARTTVHEYGGTASIVRDGVIYFSNVQDGRVYQVMANSSVNLSPITPNNKNHRFANFAIHPTRPHWVVAVLEDHTHPAPADVVNSLVLIDTLTSIVSPFIAGADFFSSPTFSPDGSKFAWVQWYHPDMPWEGGQLYVAFLESEDNGPIIRHRVKVAGERSQRAAAQPLWVDSSTLAFTYDVSGYRNLWVCELTSDNEVKIEQALSDHIKEDFGVPQWKLGDSPYAILDPQHALCSAFRDGRTVLYLINFMQKTKKEVACPYVQISCVQGHSSSSIVFLGAKVDEPMAVVLCTLNKSLEPTYTTLKSTAPAGTKLNADIVSIPQPISLVVPPDNEPLHVVYYPPANPAYVGLPEEKPPAIINCHGGPTGLAMQGLDWSKQFFTSRGFAFIDVNYGGSACYGREYINRLAGKWGLTDVQDCIQAAHQLSSAPYNLFDKNRVIIRGASAGGYLTLNCLCIASDIFCAGAATYGVSDLQALHEATHKLQSHYIPGLVGGTFEEIPDVYKARSPIHNVEKIRSPLLVLQGTADAVVPPSQAETIVNEIRERNGRVEYILFEGEGHAWRRGDTIKAAHEKEILFFMDVLCLKEDE